MIRDYWFSLSIVDTQARNETMSIFIQSVADLCTFLFAPGALAQLKYGVAMIRMIVQDSLISISIFLTSRT